ncbi:hypothetical protein [Persicobacter sp. CCB-QB2]|uniref:hypothetical protein n=1 Tax=Persicobacter sp. CCB-QB2 TaxID=1561025 RepID=UPI0006A9DAE0|nr:hypothetical protein [Persicobacter sp. CCB-QB2]
MANDIKNINGDLDFSGGDVSWGESTRALTQKIISVRKGSLKHAPGLGVGIEDYLNDDDSAKILNSINQELTSDGMTVKSLSIENSKISIDADY